MIFAQNKTLRGLRHSFPILLLLCAVHGAMAVGRTYVVVVPVANMYSQPAEKADVVSQAIYGSNVKLLASRGEWSQIQTADSYRGWTPSRYLRLVQSGAGYATSGVIGQVESLFANIYREADVTRHKPVVTVPFESRLEIAAEGSGKTEGWLRLQLPDKQTAWIQSSDVQRDVKALSIPESIDLARRFVGLPYLWGGTSSFGFDCSGFTQMIVRSRGFNMPRDADKQAAWSGVAPVDRKDLQAGDLLFFGANPKSIDHTGMYIGNGEFIQATTNGHPVVQISRLDEEPWKKLLVACRRLRSK